MCPLHICNDDLGNAANGKLCGAAEDAGECLNGQALLHAWRAQGCCRPMRVQQESD